MPKSLLKIESEFNLKDHGRTDGNNRNYLTHYVQQMLESARSQQLMKLGEAFGYWGHGIRQMTGKMQPGELEVINVNGKAVVVDNVPANRTMMCECSDDGIVSHTQEILDTDTGMIVKSMYESGAGGWSWAVDGANSPQGAIAREFNGFDYVKQPSYIDVDKQQAMFESAGVETQEQLIIKNLGNQGFSDDDAAGIITSWNRQVSYFEQVQDLQQEVLFVEGMMESKLLKSKSALDETQSELEQLKTSHAERSQMMFEALSGMPINVTDDQKRAIARMETDADRQIMIQLLESISKTDLGSLPLGGERQQLSVGGTQPTQAQIQAQKDNGFWLDKPAKSFS